MHAAWLPHPAQVMQKRRRLEQQCEQQQAEIKRLNVGMAQLRTDLQRINGLIAQNASLKWAPGCVQQGAWLGWTLPALLILRWILAASMSHAVQRWQQNMPQRRRQQPGSSGLYSPSRNGLTSAVTPAAPVAAARALLQEESFNLENRIVAEVRELEQQAAQLACQIEQQQQQRREVLAEIVEVGPAGPRARLSAACQAARP